MAVKAPGGGPSQVIAAPGAAAKGVVTAPGPIFPEEPQNPDDPRIIKAPGPPPGPAIPPSVIKPKPPTVADAISGELQVILGWTAVSEVSYYNIKRATTNGGPYTIIQSLIGTSFIDIQVSANVNYFYVFSSVNGNGEGINSRQVTGRPLPAAIPPQPGVAPAPPGSLTAQAGIGQVSLVWAASAGTLTYEVSRGTTSGGPYTTIATGLTSLSYTDSGLVAEIPVFYVSAARNLAGLSGPSNQATATPGAQVPAILPPTGVNAVAGVNQITVSWNAVSGATSYRLKKSTTSGGPYSVISSANILIYVDQGLASAVPVHYVLSAVNSLGTESAHSAQVSAIPTGPIVSPPAAPVLQGQAGNAQNSLTWNAVT